MIFDDKYKLNQNFLELEVLELLDFKDYPILNVETDNLGTKYLSYIDEYIDNKIEQRLIISISDIRLNILKKGEDSLFNLFNTSENKIIYVVQYDIYNNNQIKSYIIPLIDFIPLNPIDQNYFFQSELHETNTNKEQDIVLYAIQRRKVILDIYLKSKKIKTSLKPWVFDKVLFQLQSIIGDLLDKGYKELNNIISYSQISISSFKVSIEVEPTQVNTNLFHNVIDVPEYKKLFKVIDLLNSKSKEDLEKVIEGFKNEKFIKSYIQIVKSVILNDADINATLANPATKETITANLNKIKAQKIKMVIDEKFPIIIDIEDVIGVFLKLDFTVQEPTFTIFNDADELFKGKVENSIIDKLKADKINFSSDKYLFSIKTIYKPETTINSENVQHYLMSYKILS